MQIKEEAMRVSIETDNVATWILHSKALMKQITLLLTSTSFNTTEYIMPNRQRLSDHDKLDFKGGKWRL